MVERSLLAVSTVPLWPLLDGYSLRVRSLLEQLTSRWRVHVVAPRSRAEEKHLADIAGHFVLPDEIAANTFALPPEATRKAFGSFMNNVLADCHPDVVLLWPGAEFLAGEVCGSRPAVADRIDCQALTLWRRVLRGERLRERLQAMSDLPPIARYERRIARSVAATVVVGDDDARALRLLAGARAVHTVPNGVQVRSEQPLPTEDAQPTVTFTGVLSFPPNIDAATYFAEEVWPTVLAALPAARFSIAGKSPGAAVLALADRRGVSVTADPVDLHELMARAWVCVAPMRTGSGIKNKVLEAWSNRKPVVMTRLAANGLHLDGAPSRYVAANAAELAEMTIHLLRSAAERRSVGEESYRLVATRHTWGRAADELSAILARASAGSNGGRVLA